MTRTRIKPLPSFIIENILISLFLYFCFPPHTEYVLVSQAQLELLQLFGFVSVRAVALSVCPTHTDSCALGLAALSVRQIVSMRIEIDRHHRLELESVPLSRTLSQSLPKNLAYFRKSLLFAHKEAEQVRR